MGTDFVTTAYADSTCASIVTVTCVQSTGTAFLQSRRRIGRPLLDVIELVENDAQADRLDGEELHRFNLSEHCRPLPWHVAIDLLCYTGMPSFVLNRRSYQNLSCEGDACNRDRLGKREVEVIVDHISFVDGIEHCSNGKADNEWPQ